MANPLKIAVIGSGDIGSTLGSRWSLAGHDVVYGVRDPGSANAQRARQRSPGAQMTSIPGAVALGDIILCAIPGATMPAFMAQNGAAVDGKLVLDATYRSAEGAANALPVILQYAPRCEVFRVFSSLGWEVFADPLVGGVQADHFYAGPDSPSRATIEELIRAIGLRPI
jgi:8-hydroxy-5-deazaflavin:NADPH oxidoreductase